MLAIAAVEYTSELSPLAQTALCVGMLLVCFAFCALPLCGGMIEDRRRKRRKKREEDRLEERIELVHRQEMDAIEAHGKEMADIRARLTL
jgi:hypothetical protein